MPVSSHGMIKDGLLQPAMGHTSCMQCHAAGPRPIQNTHTPYPHQYPRPKGRLMVVVVVLCSDWGQESKCG